MTQLRMGEDRVGEIMRQATLKFKQMLKPKDKNKGISINFPTVDSSGQPIELAEEFTKVANDTKKNKFTDIVTASPHLNFNKANTIVERVDPSDLPVVDRQLDFMKGNYGKKTNLSTFSPRG